MEIVRNVRTKKNAIKKSKEILEKVVKEAKKRGYLKTSK